MLGQVLTQSWTQFSDFLSSTLNARTLHTPHCLPHRQSQRYKKQYHPNLSMHQNTRTSKYYSGLESQSVNLKDCSVVFPVKACSHNSLRGWPRYLCTAHFLLPTKSPSLFISTRAPKSHTMQQTKDAELCRIWALVISLYVSHHSL